MRSAHLQHLAALARLRLTEDEAARLRDELGDILGHIDALAEVEAGGDEVVQGRLAHRDDEPDGDPLLRPPAAFAPEWTDGFFTVPRL
ncbi:MAG: Asp-tRNA(Asn)/Glu-tRNA(Gln) amidotransferase GatCAB subunit C, partial [Gemmatimonadetes bacterium]|nr:Asp-tRNA(Asn)/Glu-tRNA(Gln) amidotransferase GatCAB subunit C [Gemmatimonadota bacterium]NIQ53566.1 Asp-tRNA(Asn)/Glu-tRNA(Gln) amidotransferase GatCAB subunit C [Gemmatimonadota bacterium]NIU76267.1 Asp-tRNA(Asn)/Glu-tRNA(Gln) amidotransferase GatCAB subunit C [Gammaproteobacteria bacterium]NIX45779.1 Asp-tRNA(Asn)/Glu-tRNA(Gln) amidotransferase GatCAB subunit C [Gemmatimonadota bacterium]